MGQELLERVGGVLSEIGMVVRASHEHFDGSGYPDGIAGEDIPLAARIVTCCDAFSAMTTDRAYRAAMPVAQALEELRRCAGAQFDPEVVGAVLGVLEGGGDRQPGVRVFRRLPAPRRLAPRG